MIDTRDTLIRRLDSEQLPKIRELGAQFAAEVSLYGGYNPEAFEPVWGHLMDAGLADVFVLENETGVVKAFLGASYAPGLYSGWASAQMQFFYLHPDVRGAANADRIFSEFLQEGKARKTRLWFVGHKVKYMSESMKRFFERHGFEAGEVLYWKHE